MIFRHCGWVAFSILLTTPSNASCEGTTVPARKRALVAMAYNNSEPDDRTIETSHPVVMAVRSFGDQVRIARELLRLGWEVRFLESRPHGVVEPAPSEQPTEANLRLFFADLKNKENYGKDDEVIVMLTGNSIALDAGDSKIRYFFCPQDAKFTGLKSVDQIKPEHHLLPLDDIYAALDGCAARRKLFVLTTALSINSHKKYAPAEPLCTTLPELPAPPDGVVLLTSCRPGEFTSWGAKLMESFERGLSEVSGNEGPKARDEVRTVDRFLDRLRSRVEEEAATFHGKLAFPQHPQVRGRVPKDWSLLPAEDKVPDRPLLVAPFTPAAARKRQDELAKELKLPGRVVGHAAGGQLVLVPPGEFSLGRERGDGDEAPSCRVRLRRPFLLGRHEVTRAEFKKVMGKDPSAFKEVPGEDTGRFPVESVGAGEMVLYCNRLSASEKLPPYYHLFGPTTDDDGKVTGFSSFVARGGPGYRLPSEAEWEYACRAGTATDYPTGDGCTGGQANIDANRPGGVAAGRYLGRTAEAGSYEPNAFGLYDMIGNVAEACQDDYDPKRYAALSKLGVTFGASHGEGIGVARGGAWNFGPGDCRSTTRLPAAASKFVGFRVARTILE